MSDFTPGPWGLTRESGGIVYIRSKHTKESAYASEFIASIDMNSETPELITKLDHYREDRQNEIQANASLIVAAPEMYRILKEIQEYDWSDARYLSIRVLLDKIESSFDQT